MKVQFVFSERPLHFLIRSFTFTVESRIRSHGRGCRLMIVAPPQLFEKSKWFSGNEFWRQKIITRNKTANVQLSVFTSIAQKSYIQSNKSEKKLSTCRFPDTSQACQRRCWDNFQLKPIDHHKRSLIAPNWFVFAVEEEKKMPETTKTVWKSFVVFLRSHHWVTTTKPATTGKQLLRFFL